jgi:hypothetical protein
MTDLDERTRGRLGRTGRPKRVRVVRLGHRVKSAANAHATDLVTSLVVGTATARRRRVAPAGRIMKDLRRAWMLVRATTDRAAVGRRFHSFRTAGMAIIEVGLTAAPATMGGLNRDITMSVPTSTVHRTPTTIVHGTPTMHSTATVRIMTAGLPSVTTWATVVRRPPDIRLTTAMATGMPIGRLRGDLNISDRRRAKTGDVVVLRRATTGAPTRAGPPKIVGMPVLRASDAVGSRPWSVIVAATAMLRRRPAAIAMKSSAFLPAFRCSCLRQHVGRSASGRLPRRASRMCVRSHLHCVPNRAL